MGYRVVFDPEAFKELKRLDRPVQQRLVGFPRTRVATLENPRDMGEALAGARLGSYWNYRVGDWWIICDIEGTRADDRQSSLRLSFESSRPSKHGDQAHTS